MWSNGRDDEDQPGQRVLLATSDDGRAWSTPHVLLGPLPGRNSGLVLTACGFHRQNGRLIAYVGQDEHMKQPDGREGRGDRAVRALVSTDGISWCETGFLGLPGIFNHGPQRLSSGRLLAAGFIAFPWTDDPTGLTGWKTAGFADLSRHEDGPVSSTGYAIKERLGIASGLCEGSWFQTDDGVVHMMLRSSTEYLWVSESRDNGENWSVPVPTGFSDNVSKFHLGRLPDGRFYYVGCPDPEPRWRRNPLVLSTSSDGIHFNRHAVLADQPSERRFEGVYKIGEYGYPHTFVHDGMLQVIVSRWKEAIEIIRVRIVDIP